MHDKELELGSGRKESNIKGIIRKANVGIATALLAASLGPYGLAQRKPHIVRHKDYTKALRTKKHATSVKIHHMKSITELLRYDSRHARESIPDARPLIAVPSAVIAAPGTIAGPFSKKVKIDRGKNTFNGIIHSSEVEYNKFNVSLESSIRSSANRHLTTIIKMYNIKGGKDRSMRTNFGAAQQFSLDKRNSILFAYSKINGRSRYNVDYVLSDKKAITAITENYDGKNSRLDFLMATGNKGIVLSYDQRSGEVGSSFSLALGHKPASYTASNLLDQQTNVISNSPIGLQGAFESAPQNSKNMLGDVLNFRCLYDARRGIPRDYAIKNRIVVNSPGRRHMFLLDENFSSVTTILNTRTNSFGIGLMYKPKFGAIVPSVSYDTLRGISFNINVRF